ncbi:SAP domain-containing protein [Leucobacter sp. NPDC077196]|uniref:SAP domain-containing protein n=1 Tax=Leucobacter sp. NPDC077196 TaxID=3154959 RepID=UPI00341D6445
MKVCQTVNLLDDQFQLVTLLPGDDVPTWAQKRVTNPAVVADASAENPSNAAPASAPVEPVAAPGTPEAVTEDKYSKLKNPELAAMLKERGLDATGNKAAMTERLKEADKAAEQPPAEDVDIWSMNVDELKAFAAENSIDVGEAATSEELAAVIELARKQ